MTMTRWSFFGAMFSALVCLGCRSEEQNAAYRHIENAQFAHSIGEYDKTIVEVSTALTLYDGGNRDGSWTFLRGRAHVALGNQQDALRDFDTSIGNANEFLHSYTLNSNPEPYAKNKFLRHTLARYYEARSDIYSRLGQHERAKDDLAVVKRLEALPTSTTERLRQLVPGTTKTP